jgi:hypothetical protein
MLRASLNVQYALKSLHLEQRAGRTGDDGGLGVDGADMHRSNGLLDAEAAV